MMNMNSEMNTDAKKCMMCGNMDGSCGHGMGAMRMHVWHDKKVHAALILALLALAVWGFIAAASGVKAFRYIGSGISATNTINVSGTGKVFAVPNIATFSFTVSETGRDVATAQDLVTKKMNDITSYLKGTAGIADADIQTTDYSANPKYEQTAPCTYSLPCPSSGKIVGYDVAETITVKVRKTDTAGDVLSNVGSRGVSNVSGLSFTVDNEEQLQADARDKAIRDAEGKAQILANQLGVKLVRVVGFNENGSQPMYAYKTMSAGSTDAAMAPAAANVQLGQNTITSDVNVTYEIQ